MIQFIKPTIENKGFNAAIEVRGSIFNLRSFFEIDTQFTHIDISDEDGNFIAEFCSGFGIDLEEDAEDLELHAIKVFEHIDENLVF